MYRMDNLAVMLFINHHPNPLSAGFLFGLLHGLIRRLQSVHDREEIIAQYDQFVTAHRLPGFVLAPRRAAPQGADPAASGSVSPGTSSIPSPQPRNPKK